MIEDYMTELSNLDYGELCERSKMINFHEWQEVVQNAHQYIESHKEEVNNFKAKYKFESLQK